MNQNPKTLLLTLLTLTPLIAQTPPTTNAAYLLGPNDQLTVFVADLPDEFADKTFRIDTNGDISLPIIGHLHAAGLTTSGLELAAQANLVHVLKHPQVSISIAGFGSQSVSILGAVNAPGIHQLEGHKSLFEVLSLAGGLRPDAGYQVMITRSLDWGAIPVANATVNSQTQTSEATIPLKDIINATSPAENIAIMPNDTISVPKAEIVYAVGWVNKPGGFPLNEHETLSTLQVVSLAEGLQKTAALQKAKILRAVPGTNQRTEIAINLKDLMAGKAQDLPLQPNDILFVPNSNAKAAGYRSVDAIVAAAGGAALLARY
jgi:polysaccharide export outer membrane protein